MTEDLSMFNAGVPDKPKPRVSSNAVERERDFARMRREGEIQRRLHEIRQLAVHSFKAQR